MYLTSIFWVVFSLSFIHVNRGYIRHQQAQEKFLDDHEEEEDVIDGVHV